MPAHPTKLIPTLLALAALAGCASPAWYAQAVSGHMDIMRQREDIDDVLRDPGTSPELAARLQIAQEARRFGIENLGLPVSKSYTQYVHTGREAVTWNVVAAPEFSVEAKKWCFPASGCVPYRGYFDEEKALRFADTLRGRGYDVSVTPAVAYSTLGWFDDPLLDTMMQYSDAQLAATIFHEMAHQQLYVKGDAAFNEGFAVFVEEMGLEAWLTSRDEPESLERWRDSQAASARFSEFLAQERESLELLYARAITEAEMRQLKSKALGGMSVRYLEIVEAEWEGKNFYSGWFENELNNARLALAATYRGSDCAFRRLFMEAGSDLGAFMGLASVKAALPSSERAAWLQQDCNVIAPAGDL